MTPAATQVRRVALKKDGYYPILFQLKPSLPLQNTIADICEKWKMTEPPSQFSLKYFDTKIFITKENIADIHDGVILTLDLNIELSAAKYLMDIEQPDMEIRKRALDNLAGSEDERVRGQVEDPLFAREFVSKNGLDALVKTLNNTSDMEMTSQVITAMQLISEHAIYKWEDVDSKFVGKILDYVNKSKNVEAKVVHRSLALLDSIMTTGSTLYIRIMNQLNLENLAEHIKSPHSKLQISALSLCNSILQKMEHSNRKKFATTLVQKGYVKNIQEIISSPTTLSSEVKHQLSIYNSLCLGLLAPRMRTTPNYSDPKLMADLNRIYNLAFDTAPNPKGLGKSDYKRLGFSNGEMPLRDFEDSPPGMLAYDAMLYFANFHQDQYVKVIMENFGRDEELECPFAKCTQQLTVMLCNILKVEEGISDSDLQFQPLFFSENVFEELYSVSIQLVNKTWKEMRATGQDFPKVMGVVKDKVKRVLTTSPETIEKFRTEAFSLTYQKFLRLMQQEAQERNILDSQTKPVMEMRDQILPEIQELVRQQRLAQLVEGLVFGHYKKQQLRGHWFCCLSPNHRFLHYGDVQSNDAKPSIDSLPNKIPISEITSIVVGKDTLHAKNLKKGMVPFTFSVMHNQEEHLDFIAPNQQLFNVWTDALNSLLGNNESRSDDFNNDLDMLLNMEMKLLLLDLENVRIPEVPPPVPRQPDNYDFFYKDI